MASPRRLVCPWCGHVHPPGSPGSPGAACAVCGGGFDAEARRETQNDMGPWFVRDPRRPFQPGCSYEVMASRIDAGEIGPTTILRGPTTRQLWAAARRVPSVAHLLGYCHACSTKVSPDAERCPSCRARFGPWLDRDRLGLAPVRVDPDEAPDEEDAGLMVIDLPDRGPRPTAGAIVVTGAAGSAGIRSMREGANDPEDEGRRLEALARRLAAGEERSDGSGAWTAMIAALLIILAGLVLLPMIPGMLQSVREGEAAGEIAADLPGGAFRSPREAPAAETTSEGVPTPSPSPSPSPTPVEEPAEGDPVDAPDAIDRSAPPDPVGAPVVPERVATPVSPAGAAEVDLRRLRRLAVDPLGDPARRLRAWRMIERSIVSARERGEPLPAAFDAAAVRAGIDRVHLDAFLQGWAPSDLLAADPGPADPRSGPGPSRAPAAADVRFFSPPDDEPRD